MDIKVDEIKRVASILVPYWSQEGFENFKILSKAGKLPVEVKDAWREWQAFVVGHSRNDVKKILDMVAPIPA